MSVEYVAILESFAERHFVKDFERKYKNAWEITWRGIVEEFKNFEVLLLRSNATTITHTEHERLCKVEFRVHNTKESRRTSGNRYIVVLNDTDRTAHILLVYCKTDVRGNRETDWWKAEIRNNYPQYRGLI